MKNRFVTSASLILLGLGTVPDLQANVWEWGPSLPAPHHQSVGLNLNGTLLSLGGLPLKNNRCLVYALAPGALKWSDQVPQLPDDTAGLGAAVDSLGRVIVFGGKSPTTGTATASGYVYDLVTGPGAAIASKHFAVYDFAFASDAGHLVYAIGGAAGPGQTTDSMRVERYDGQANAWTVLAPLPSPRTKALALCDGMGHILVIGGINPVSATFTTTVFSYDIAGNAWTQLPDVPQEFLGPVYNAGATAQGADGRLYFVGPGNAVFDPMLGVWFSGPQQQLIRGSPGAVLGSDGFIYVMGGDANPIHQGLLDTVERLDTGPSAPEIFSRAGLAGAVGSPYAYQVVASGNPRAGFVLVNGPAGITVNATNGWVSWTPANNQAGDNPVTVRATNSLGMAEQSFTISVQPLPPPVLGPINMSAGTLTLSWSAVPGQVYRVLSAPDLTTPSWTAVPGDVTASGSTASKPVAMTGAARFFRIQMLP